MREAWVGMTQTSYSERENLNVFSETEGEKHWAAPVHRQSEVPGPRRPRVHHAGEAGGRVGGHSPQVWHHLDTGDPLEHPQRRPGGQDQGAAPGKISIH